MLLEKIPTPIHGCFLLRAKKLADHRGHFIKYFQKEAFAELGLDLSITESYFSVSKQGVLRGMHFQIPPYEHHKLVTCLQGQVLDVVCDLRLGSPSYGQCAHFNLSEETPDSIYMPAGLAHGFYTLSQQATLLYNVTSSYASQADSGIAWHSLPFAWPNPSPTVSERDQTFVTLADFKTPFIFNAHD